MHVIVRMKLMMMMVIIMMLKPYGTSKGILS